MMVLQGEMFFVKATQASYLKTMEGGEFVTGHVKRPCFVEEYVLADCNVNDTD